MTRAALNEGGERSREPGVGRQGQSDAVDEAAGEVPIGLSPPPADRVPSPELSRVRFAFRTAICKGELQAVNGGPLSNRLDLSCDATGNESYIMPSNSEDGKCHCCPPIFTDLLSRSCMRRATI